MYLVESRLGNTPVACPDEETARELALAIYGEDDFFSNIRAVPLVASLCDAPTADDVLEAILDFDAVERARLLAMLAEKANEMEADE